MVQQHESSLATLTQSLEEELTSILSSGVDEITNMEKSILDNLEQRTLRALESEKSICPTIPAVFFEKAEQSIEKLVKEQSSLLDQLAEEAHRHLDATTHGPAEDKSGMAGETTDIGVAALPPEKAMDIALSGFEGAAG